MPYDLKEIAAISGMPGLYRLVKPTRAGVIVEALNEQATRSVASARNKVSLLQEISIYTQDYDQTVPLTEVFDRIYQKHGSSLALTHKSDDRDLTAFMGEIIPDYDRDRVYMSDIKKLVQWYHVVSSRLEYQEAAEEATEAAAAETEAPAAAPAKKAAKKADDEATEEKPKAKKKAAEPAEEAEKAPKKSAKKKD
ncbi:MULTISPECIES: DUF5606 family protein [Hymenobacter]|uniref:DUF5606 domain-containing protein n=1 Tax=Hymenobacter yonginensis TaxID=748197 RepID=A0ABY7PT75_9BACT|nr:MULTISPECIES: DUF5606 domain-containing protein [Hymenobacter]AII54115.1 hypothetical protein N008_19275 [Hymenobacter sp. APR13]WBO85807.1 DUF5606 domain-containing protein [Hymenobacter yonginensis]